MSFDIWHVAIPVTELERAVGFYCGVLGMHLVGRDDYSDKEQAFVAVRPGGFTLELFRPKDGRAHRHPDHLAFECADLAAFRAQLAARGHPVPEILTFDSGVQYLPLKDPDGVELEFFQGRALYEGSIKP